jgi:hypothetical protein
MKKSVFLRKSSKIFLTKNPPRRTSLIISGDPSMEKQEEFLRMTKKLYFAELIAQNNKEGK